MRNEERGRPSKNAQPHQQLADQLNVTQEANRKTTCDMLLAFENRKRKRSWVIPSKEADIDCKTKSLWTEDYDLCLVDSEGCYLSA